MEWESPWKEQIYRQGPWHLAFPKQFLFSQRAYLRGAFHAMQWVLRQHLSMLWLVEFGRIQSPRFCPFCSSSLLSCHHLGFRSFHSPPLWRQTYHCSPSSGYMPFRPWGYPSQLQYNQPAPWRPLFASSQEWRLAKRLCLGQTLSETPSRVPWPGLLLEPPFEKADRLRYQSACYPLSLVMNGPRYKWRQHW